MARKRLVSEKIRIEFKPGVNNVFADLGFRDPEEELARAHLSSCIGQIISERGLSQKAAAELMGIDQPKVSAILNGYVDRFSSERLLRLLRRLGHDIELVIKDKSRTRTFGRIRVVDEGRPRRRRTARRTSTRG